MNVFVFMLNVCPGGWGGFGGFCEGSRALGGGCWPGCIGGWGGIWLADVGTGPWGRVWLGLIGFWAAGFCC
jgi:hypothetical protein